MKKVSLYSFVFLLVVSLSGCSTASWDDSREVSLFFLILLGIVCLGIFINSVLKWKRDKQIRESEAELGDISHLKSFGDDKCRFYFDVLNKQVLIMRFRLSGVQKEYVDGFEYSSEQFCLQKDPCFCIYDSKNRQMLTGSYKEENLDYEVKKNRAKDTNAP